MGPRTGLNGCGKSRPPTEIRSPDRPDRSESLYRPTVSNDIIMKLKECGWKISYPDLRYYLTVCVEDMMKGSIRSLHIVPEAKSDLRISYVLRSKSFRPDQLFKVTEIKQLCYSST